MTPTTKAHVLYKEITSHVVALLCEHVLSVALSVQLSFNNVVMTVKNYPKLQERNY